jgi:hypothetical protein
MCEPTTLVAAALALTTASTAATIYSQQQAADAQAATNQRQYENQMTAYKANLLQSNVDLANLNRLKQQEAEDTSAKKITANAETRRDMAKATVAAGEAGVSGLSVDALLAELGGKGGTANTNIETNYLRKDMALEQDRANIYTSKTNNWAQTASAINSLKTPVQPDYIGAGLRIAGAGVQYQTSMNDIKRGK